VNGERYVQDDVLTDEDLNTLQKVFEVTDLNKDGKLSPPEFHKVLCSFVQVRLFAPSVLWPG